MIPVLALLALGIGVAVVLSPFWQKIVEFSKSVVAKIQAKIKTGLEGFLVYLKRTKNRKIEKKQVNFIKNEQGKYKQLVVTEEINEDEIEEKFRKKLELDAEFNIDMEKEIDITEDMELQLTNAS